MNLLYNQFQALSSCEAQAIQRMVKDAVILAYEAGASVIMEHHDNPLEELMSAHSKAMEELGFSGEGIPRILVRILHEQVKKENHET